MEQLAALEGVSCFVCQLLDLQALLLWTYAGWSCTDVYHFRQSRICCKPKVVGSKQSTLSAGAPGSTVQSNWLELH